MLVLISLILIVSSLILISVSFNISEGTHALFF